MARGGRIQTVMRLEAGVADTRPAAQRARETETEHLFRRLSCDRLEF